MITVRVDVTLKPSLLDSAGRTVGKSLRDLGFAEVEDVRIGKTITLQMESYDEERVKAMCQKLLANPVIENFVIEAQP
jgi:phosphoribosylformylglycinamidine synthase